VACGDWNDLKLASAVDADNAIDGIKRKRLPAPSAFIFLTFAPQTRTTAFVLRPASPVA
jgi:hypothetical protein